METKISFIKPYKFEEDSIINENWIFNFYSFTYIKGFFLRIFGIQILRKEKDSLKKLIEIHKKMRNE